MSDPVLLTMSGSLRREATNRRLLNEAVRLFGACQRIDANLNLPLYDGDAEVAKGIPETVSRLAEQIMAVDAVMISTPEYNKGISGVLKNALDWISRTKTQPWKDKPVAIMSSAAGRAGGERGQAMLRQCLVVFQPQLISGPEVHLGDAGNQFDSNGRLISEPCETALRELMAKLRGMLR